MHKSYTHFGIGSKSWNFISLNFHLSGQTHIKEIKCESEYFYLLPGNLLWQLLIYKSVLVTSDSSCYFYSLGSVGVFYSLWSFRQPRSLNYIRILVLVAETLISELSVEIATVICIRARQTIIMIAVSEFDTSYNQKRDYYPHRGIGICNRESEAATSKTENSTNIIILKKRITLYKQSFIKILEK